MSLSGERRSAGDEERRRQAGSKRRLGRANRHAETLWNGNALSLRRPFGYLLIQMADGAVWVGAAFVMLPGFARLADGGGKQQNRYQCCCGQKRAEWLFPVHKEALSALGS